MTSLTFVTPDGAEVVVDATDGESVMATAINHRVPGILGECGGSLACATCHVYVPEKGREAVSVMTDFENEMLDMTASERTAESRLSCQITVGPEIDGLRILLPLEQI